MKLKKYYIVYVTHPNLRTVKNRSVFTAKNEAMTHARKMAKETCYEIEVYSEKGFIGLANFDGVPTDGLLYTSKRIIENLDP